MKALAFFLVAVALLATAIADEDANYLQMRRTACLVLSRYHSNTQKDTVEGLMKALPPSDQPKYINKMYATGVQLCEEHITQSEVTEVPLLLCSSTQTTPTSTQQSTSICSRVSTTTALPKI